MIVKNAIILMVLAMECSANTLPIAVLRQHGGSTYAFCTEGENCPISENKGYPGAYLIVVILGLCIFSLAALGMVIKSLTGGSGKLISR